MPHCTDCGAWVSNEYQRVMSDNDGAVQCVSCERSIR